MNIVIIGSGNVGSALATSLGRAGHVVENPVRGREADAVAAADVVILAVPWSAHEDVTTRIAPGVKGKLVIDAMNPLKPDGSGLATVSGLSGAEIVAAALPGAVVVKAFNTLFASIQGHPDAHGLTLDAFYATDDEDAKGEVGILLRTMGFRPVYVGPLSRRAMGWSAPPAQGRGEVRVLERAGHLLRHLGAPTGRESLERPPTARMGRLTPRRLAGRQTYPVE